MTSEQNSTFTGGLMNRFKTYFIAGVVTVAPIGLTILVIQWIINLMDTFLYTILPDPLRPDNLLGIHIPGLGFILSLGFVVVAGFVAANYFGSKLLSYIEILVRKIPLVNSIYTLFKQVADSTLGRDRKGFRKPVLLEYPRKGIWSIGFMTGTAQGEVQNIISRKVLNVFIPTTPNPTSGFYLLVPEEDVKVLSMSVEEAFKLIVSGGMVAPREGIK